jgi:hypothetical protein
MKRFLLIFSLLILCAGVYAQGPTEKTKSNKPTSQPAAQPIDKDYTDSIIKNTTDKMFLTELVDHLPASDKVPSPEKILGYPI